MSTPPNNGYSPVPLPPKKEKEKVPFLSTFGRFSSKTGGGLLFLEEQTFLSRNLIFQRRTTIICIFFLKTSNGPRYVGLFMGFGEKIVNGC